MSSNEHSSRKALFDRAFREFIDAHARGMKSLQERDFRGLQDAITDESVAVDTVSAAITEALGLPDRRSAVEPEDGRDSVGSLEAEHAQLFERMQALERDHRGLGTRRDDVEAHRAHRAKLEAHIAELKGHLERLRAHAIRGRAAPDR